MHNKRNNFLCSYPLELAKVPLCCHFIALLPPININFNRKLGRARVNFSVDVCSFATCRIVDMFALDIFSSLALTKRSERQATRHTVWLAQQQPPCSCKTHT